MSTVFTFPGKSGDALHQWPVAYHWSKQKGQKFTAWLDERALKPLVPLFESQECCEKVELKPGIEHYGCGGQPWHFSLPTSDHTEHTIYHLGLREFPQRQLTLQCMVNLPVKIDTKAIADEPSLIVEPLEPANRVILHGTFRSHHTGVPGFWKFLHLHQKDLEVFDEVVFVGSEEERTRAKEIYPQWKDFADDRNFLTLARYMAGSKLVIGAGSCVVALAGQLKVPCVRVHDEIGNAPRVIWSNLGPHQINETEPVLRQKWPEFRDSLLGVAA